MFTLLNNRKVFRDPLYGYINVDYKIISDLIDSSTVQRLRRIKQLAGVSMVFQTAEHSRFTHALGTYELARKTLENVNDIRDNLTQYEQLVFLIAALLHDIGHGPYSHSFENVFKIPHEVMTSRIILGDTDVNQILSISPTLAKDVSDVILCISNFPLIEQLISSQLDVDRMDYLRRDSHFTGTPYGSIDVDKILRSMHVRDHQIVFKYSGVHTIENYLLSRYHMYWQVYYHPISRCYEVILEKIYCRINELIEAKREVPGTYYLYHALKNGDVKSYLELDDSYVMGLIKSLIDYNDHILSELCFSFVNRRLFKCLDLAFVSEEEKDKYRDIYMDKPYYFLEEKVTQQAYYNKHKNKTIFIYMPNDEIISLEDYSPIVRDLLSNGNKESRRLYYKELSK